jgi:hypothetical protein
MKDASWKLFQRGREKSFWSKGGVLFKTGRYELDSHAKYATTMFFKIDDKYLDEVAKRPFETWYTIWWHQIQTKWTSSTLWGFWWRANIAWYLKLFSLYTFSTNFLFQDLIWSSSSIIALATRVIRGTRLQFPDKARNISAGFLPLLEAVWCGKKLMKDNGSGGQVFRTYRSTRARLSNCSLLL